MSASRTTIANQEAPGLAYVCKVYIKCNASRLKCNPCLAKIQLQLAQKMQLQLAIHWP